MRVTDALGRSVAFSHPPRRVISLAPNVTEIVYAAGAGSRLVAVTSSCNYPPAADTLAHVDALPVDFEAVAARNPDLVLATDQINAPRDADTFAAIDVPVYFFSFPTVQSVFDAVRRTGQLLGAERAAADTARALEGSLDRLRRRTAPIDTTDRPRVLVLIGDETLYAFGGASYVHTLVEAAGGRSVTAGLDAAAPTLSEEYVIQQQPDVIVGAFGADYDTGRLLDLHPTWDVVPAIQNDRVYSLPPELLLRPGPRLVQGAEAMAEVLHPGLPAAPSP
jgi:ABC-type Fe3+-hydroxamate transport system substrate-binding protein